MGDPLNWNEAIARVAGLYGEWIDNCAGEPVDDLLRMMDQHLEPMRQWVRAGGIGAEFYLDPADYVMPLEIALAGLLGDVTQDQYRSRLFNIADLACRKQHDYGQGNILAFGHQGIIVRISDKLERLKNLLGRDVAGVAEPLEDAWVDIIGYCLIGLMLLNDWFTLPLAA